MCMVRILNLKKLQSLRLSTMKRFKNTTKSYFIIFILPWMVSMNGRSIMR